MDSNKKKFLDILEKSYGIVLTACKSCSLPRSTYYKWLKEDNEFKERVDDIQEMAIDFVESKLIQRIAGDYETDPSDTAIIFYLKTKGKKRGYVERMEIDNVNPLILMQIDPLSNATPTDDSTTEDSGA